MKVCIDLARGQVLSESPAGLHGHFSFKRFTEILRAAGEIKPGESVSHLTINTQTGMCDFKIERTSELASNSPERTALLQKGVGLL